MKVLKLKNSVMFFYDHEKKCFVLYSPRRDENVCIEEDHPIFGYFGARKEAVTYKKIVDDITYYYRPREEYRNINVDAVLSLLREYGAEICIPVIINGEIKGLWIVGEKKNNSVFQREEISWLKNIAVQVSVMAENIMLYDKLINSERLAMLGKMSAAVAHEIRNPLTGLNGFVQLVRSDRGNKAAMDRFLDIAPGEFKRLEKLTDNLLALSHVSALRIEEVELAKLLDNVYDLMEHTFKINNIRVVKNYKSPITVKADVKQIRQVVLNIVMNAVQAMEAGGTLEISSGVEPMYGKNYTAVYFRDSGAGFDEKLRRGFLSRFLQLKRTGPGWGSPYQRTLWRPMEGSSASKIPGQGPGPNCSSRNIFDGSA